MFVMILRNMLLINLSHLIKKLDILIYRQEMYILIEWDMMRKTKRLLYLLKQMEVLVQELVTTIIVRQEIELCLWVVTSTTARQLGCSTGLVAMLLLTRAGFAGLAFLSTSKSRGTGGRLATHMT